MCLPKHLHFKLKGLPCGNERVAHFQCSISSCNFFQNCQQGCQLIGAKTDFVMHLRSLLYFIQVTDPVLASKTLLIKKLQTVMIHLARSLFFLKREFITFPSFQMKIEFYTWRTHFSWNASYWIQFRCNWVKYNYLWEVFQLYNQIDPWGPQVYQSMKFSWSIRTFQIQTTVHYDKLLKEELFSQLWNREGITNQLFITLAVLTEVQSPIIIEHNTFSL